MKTQRLMGILFLSVGLFVQTAQAQVACFDLFSQRPYTLFQDLSVVLAEDLALEISLEEHPIHMAETLWGVMQGDLVVETISLPMRTRLVNTLHMHSQMRIARDVIIVAIENEKLRRQQQAPVDYSQYFGFEAQPSNFGLSLALSQQTLQGKSLAELNDYAAELIGSVTKQIFDEHDADGAVLRTSLHFDEAYFFGQEPVAFLRGFKIGSRDGGMDPLATTWLYRTLLRERFLRSQIEDSMSQNGLLWDISNRDRDDFLLALGAFPELLPFVDRLRSLGIDYDDISFAEPRSATLRTHHRRTIFDGALAQMVFVKEFEDMKDGFYQERTVVDIELRLTSGGALGRRLADNWEEHLNEIFYEELGIEDMDSGIRPGFLVSEDSLSVAIISSNSDQALDTALRFFDLLTDGPELLDSQGRTVYRGLLNLPRPL